MLIGSAGVKNKSAPWKILENHQPHLKQRFGQTPYLPTTGKQFQQVKPHYNDVISGNLAEVCPSRQEK